MKKLICFLLPLTLFPTVHAAPSEAALQQCAVDMCGPAERLEHTKGLGIMQVPSLQNKEFLKTVLFPRLEKFLESSVFIIQTQVNSFDSFLARSEREPLNQDQQTIMKLAAILKKLGPVFGKALDPKSTRDKLIIDPELVVKETPTEDAALTRKWVALVNAYLSHPDYSTVRVLESFTYKLLVQSIQKQSGLPPVLSVPPYLRRLKTEINSITTHLGNSLTTGLDLKALDKAIAMEELSDAEEKMIVSILRLRLSMNTMINPATTLAALQIPMTFAEAMKLANWQAESAKVRGYLASPENIKAEKDKVFSACTISITKFMAAAPSDLQQHKSLELLARVKEASKQAARKYFNGDALTRALATIDKTQFTKPLSSVAVEKMISERFERIVGQVSNYAAHIEKVKNGEAEWQSLALVTLMNGVGEEGNLFGDTIRGCKELEPKAISDASYSNLDTITMSWQSVMSPEMGAGVIAHELGHAISAVVGKLPEGNETYKNTRSCVISRHQDLLPADKKTVSVHHYQEEDWADEFAATVITELNRVWPYSKNFACILLSIKDQKYTDLSLQNIEGQDVHSTSFLRALVSHANKSALPASCIKVLDQNAQQAIQRSCGQ